MEEDEEARAIAVVFRWRTEVLSADSKIGLWAAEDGELTLS